MWGRIIPIQKKTGAVGKTTTAINLSACLAVLGKNTLLVDTDPQSNASSGIGISKKNGFEKSIYDVMISTAFLNEIIQKGPMDNLDVVPSNKKLVGADVELVDSRDRENILKHALNPLKSRYKYIIIDCPPALNLLTINALGCADSVIVPMQCEYYALEGISDLLESIDRVRVSLNPTLDLEGVLLTMYDSRTNLADQVAEEVRSYFKDQVFDSVIPRNVRLSEAPSHGLPIIMYDNNCRGAEAYLNLAQEIIARET